MSLVNMSPFTLSESSPPYLGQNDLTQPRQFQVIGSMIYDPNGQIFIPQGTNMFAWEGTTRVDSIINTWGFNTIRVPNYLLGSYDQPHPAINNYDVNHQIVDGFTQDNRVIIFSAHDRTGRYYQNEEFEQLKAYWQEMAREFKDNPYVWFNLHNEPGRRNPNPEQWVHYHRTLIDIVRAEGATNIIIVDGESWGQDFYSQTILNDAHRVMEGNRNLLFSVHVYEQWNDHNVGDYLSQLQEKGIPTIVGEYGASNGEQSTIPASLKMMEAVQEQDIGRIVWVFSANDRNDLTTGPGGHGYHFNGENIDELTELGRLVWDDLQRSQQQQQQSPGEQRTLTPNYSSHNLQPTNADSAPQSVGFYQLHPRLFSFPLNPIQILFLIGTMVIIHKGLRRALAAKRNVSP
ncbi:MAG: glycoside hydrolase family 5 protein [Symploca sp. SIO2B6]|nr:glycoside hydrolase family 5 protein [Symploca sp. SIO2B6]